jgi:hypothetical protein
MPFGSPDILDAEGINTGRQQVAAALRHALVAQE